MKFKSHFICCLLFLGISGCMSQEKFDENFKPTFDLYAVSHIYYYSHNNRWPTSIDELKSFCSENQENCPLLDWNKYAHTHLETLPDGSLKIETYIPDEPNKPLNGEKPNIVITISKPAIQEDGNSFNNRR